MEGGKREVDTAGLFQCVCAQASALGSTKRPLCDHKHTGTHTHPSVCVLSQQILWYLSPSRASPPPVILPCFHLSSISLLLCLSVVFFSSSCWIIHVSPLCQMACALLILTYSFHSGHACSGVCLRGVNRYLWVGGPKNGRSKKWTAHSSEYYRNLESLIRIAVVIFVPLCIWMQILHFEHLRIKFNPGPDIGKIVMMMIMDILTHWEAKWCSLLHFSQVTTAYFMC